MTRRRLALQATFVIVLALLVSWPQLRTVRAATVWVTTPGTLVGDVARMTGAGAGADDGTGGLDGLNGAAARARLESAADAARRRAASRGGQFTSQALRALGAQLNVIQGRALTLTNEAIPFARIVLRNIVTGQVIARVQADENGNYQFIDLDASAYIIELLGDDGSVLAASESVAVQLGTIQQTTVRAGARASQLLGLGGATATAGGTGTNFTGSLEDTTTAARDQDVRQTNPDVRPEVSPGRAR